MSDLVLFMCRFKIVNELENEKLFREFNIKFDNYLNDLEIKKEETNFSDLKLIFNNLRTLLKRQGYIVNWKEMEKQNHNEIINTLSMASPFSLEEKQILLESPNLSLRKEKLEKILETYGVDNFNNTTLQ